MSLAGYLKCACHHCGGHIEFPVDAIGTSIPCPHCKVRTELSLETPETFDAAERRRSLKWIIAGAVILLAGLLAIVVLLIAARRMAERTRRVAPVTLLWHCVTHRECRAGVAPGPRALLRELSFPRPPVPLRPS